MACGFKLCRGRRRCLLEHVSPCSAHETDEVQRTTQSVKPSYSMRRLGFVRTGFVNSAASIQNEAIAEYLQRTDVNRP